MSKKGQEMSVNIVVGIILGVAMLVAGLFLFFRIMDKTNNTAETLDEQMKDKMNQALDSGEQLYIPVTNVQAKRNEAVFWIGIRNIDSQAENFQVEIEPISGTPFTVNPGPYLINAKENKVDIPVIVNMKGVRQRVSFIVSIKVEAPDGQYVPYGNNKIVNVQP
jgi:hypothetical protein